MLDQEDPQIVNRCIEKLQHTEQEFINLFQLMLWRRLKINAEKARKTPPSLAAWIDLYSLCFRTFFGNNPELFREYCECRDQETNNQRLEIIEQHIYRQ